VRLLERSYNRKAVTESLSREAVGKLLHHLIIDNKNEAGTGRQHF
jgi:hypothetical protein